MTRLAGGRVLVVEDNIDLGENLIEILEDEGAEVRLARDAAATVKMVRDPFDVALVDVRLPDASGLAMLPRLRRAGDGCAEIILVTGNATLEDAIEAVAGGAYAYILKPFKPDDLIGNVERALRQVRSSRQAAALSARLAQSEASLRTLVDTVQALLLVLDAEGRVVSVNSAVAAATGVAAAELIGLPWIDRFVPESEQDKVREVFDKAAANDAPILYESRILVVEPSGERLERWINWRALRLSEPEGAVRIYASGIDVSELRQLQRRTELAQRLAAVGTLTAGLAHEVRNPLNSATLQLQLLERRLGRVSDDPRLKEPLRLVQAEVDRLSRLVGEFLGFARPPALSLEPVDVGEIIRQLADMERPALSEQHIELSVSGPDGPMSVTADPGKLQQVILNLVRNAAEATELCDRPGRIAIDVVEDGDAVKILVRDNGPGVPAELRPRLFEPFFSTKPSGTGLGLSICYSIIAQHGGDIALRSDGDTEFEISLPKTPPWQRPAGAAAPGKP